MRMALALALALSVLALLTSLGYTANRLSP